MRRLRAFCGRRGYRVPVAVCLGACRQGLVARSGGRSRGCGNRALERDGFRRRVQVCDKLPASAAVCAQRGFRPAFRPRGYRGVCGSLAGVDCRYARCEALLPLAYGYARRPRGRVCEHQSHLDIRLPRICADSHVRCNEPLGRRGAQNGGNADGGLSDFGRARFANRHYRALRTGGRGRLRACRHRRCACCKLDFRRLAVVHFRTPALRSGHARFALPVLLLGSPRVRFRCCMRAFSKRSVCMS